MRPAVSSWWRLARWTALLGLGGCVDAYMPDVVEAPTRYLVVDGFINGNGITRIKLSRSINVATTTAPPPEIGDKVLIVDETGRTWPLAERSPGLYQSDSLLLPAGRRYQLRLSVGGGAKPAVYESALVLLKVTPAFQVAPVREAGQVKLLLSTGDASGQSRYYRWNYQETWQFNSAFNSVLEAVNGRIVTRRVPIYTCWHQQQTSQVLHTSTASLSQDRVQNRELLSFADTAERLHTRYSVLVSQYVETAEEFAYNELLRKNTEAVGTPNDPLPVQLTGNVRRVNGDPAEPVLGYVGAHTVLHQRLFLTPQSLGLPLDWAFHDPYQSCELSEELTPDPGDRTDPLQPGHTRVFASKEYYPVEIEFAPIRRGNKHDSIANLGSTRYCVDCTLRGTNVKPSFW